MPSQFDEAYEADIAIGTSMREDWGAMWPIEVNANSVISSDVTDWPCLITDVHFAEEAWQYIQSDGRDLRFTSDEYGVLELYFDLVRIDVANKSAHIYVRIPNLNSDSNTTIYAWVGNSKATAPSAAWMQNTYPSDALAILPMQEGAGTTIYDRTANGNDGAINGPTWAMRGLAFDGDAADNVDLGTIAAFESTTAATVSFWCTVNNITEDHALLSNVKSYSVDRGGLLVFFDSIKQPNGIPNVFHAACYSTGHTAAGLTTAANYVAADTWYHIAVTVELGSATGLKLYVNGTLQASASLVGVGTLNGASPLYLGKNPAAAGAELKGAMDATMIHTRAFTADEIALEYLMLSAPATFAAAGDTEIIIPIYSADISIQSTENISYSANIILQSTTNISYSSDILLQTTGNMSYTADIITQSTINISYEADIDIQDTYNVSYTATIYTIHADVDISYTAEAVLYKTINVSYSSNTFILKVEDIYYSADIKLTKTHNDGYSANIIIVLLYSDKIYELTNRTQGIFRVRRTYGDFKADFRTNKEFRFRR